MSLKQRIVAFSELGQFMSQFITENKLPKFEKINDLFYDKIDHIILGCKARNGWFDRDSILLSINAIVNKITEQSLVNWTSNYKIEDSEPKRILVVLAGNIPLVGFDDCLATLITGNIFIGKLSSKDDKLLPALLDVLKHLEPSFADRIVITDEFVKNINGVIATGSNNSARYFESYFGKYPNIIRNNRNSVAILTGNETIEELAELGKDVFQYYGLGCRSVSKLFIPNAYQFETFFGAIKPLEVAMDSTKYANNYIYNKSLLEIGREPYIDNGSLILKQHAAMNSPVAMVYYDFYEDLELLEKQLAEQQDEIQCVVGNCLPNSVPFGKAQQPELTDYADGVDTVEFLVKL